MSFVDSKSHLVDYLRSERSEVRSVGICFQQDGGEELHHLFGSSV